MVVIVLPFIVIRLAIYQVVSVGIDSDYNVYNEIETNGTVVIENDLFDIIDQINCSPKLANSGMTAKQRIVLIFHLHLLLYIATIS